MSVLQTEQVLAAGIPAVETTTKNVLEEKKAV